LRLYASARLDPELYARVKAAGFRWAAKQDLFVAPAWSPEREDLLIELAGQIDDEDKGLVERAGERAERFEDYGEKRNAESEAAYKQARDISHALNGQPILVGHHSERATRRAYDRVHDGFTKSAALWKTSKYWAERAAGAIRHAKYKERPDVRARRIKGLEADQRKQQRGRAELTALLKFWTRETISETDAAAVCNLLDHGGAILADGSQHWSGWSAITEKLVTVDELRRQRLERLPVLIAHRERWLDHIANRLTYERAMLAEAGGTVADRTGPEKGGACRCWASPRGGWSYIVKVNKVSVTVLDNWGNGGDNFTRTIPFDKLAAVMTAAQVEEKRAAGLLVEVQKDSTGAVQGFVLADA
jgi:hypothetical protein